MNGCLYVTNGRDSMRPEAALALLGNPAVAQKGSPCAGELSIQAGRA